MFFLDKPLLKERVESIFLGNEEYVFVKSKDYETNPKTFLNHDESDDMSYRWFLSTGRENTIEKRRYLDEIYSVLDGVAMGAGVSILPQHLALKDKRLKILYKSQKLLSPVYLIYHKKSYYPPVFTAVKDAIQKHFHSHFKA